MCFVLAVFFLAGWATIGFAQEEDVAAGDSLVEVADNALAAPLAPTIQTLVAQRLEALRGADRQALENAREACEVAVRELSVKGPELRQAARQAYEEARTHSDLAKETSRQIAELEGQLDQQLRDLPEVKEKTDEIKRVEQALLVELQVRTALGGMIAADETELPETDLEDN